VTVAPELRETSGGAAHPTTAVAFIAATGRTQGSPSAMTHAPESPAPAEMELVQALQRGCDDAYATVVREHGRALLAAARRMLGNEDDARDAMQEAMVRAFRSVGSFEGKSRLGTWLHRIVVTSCLMKLRARRSRPECSIEDLAPKFTSDGHHVDPPCPWSEFATERLQSAESRTILWRAIDGLPAGYREVVVLRDIEQLPTEATAQLLGVTTNAVKIRLHRARQALRTLLDEHLKDLEP
jgi:RNA polymerase sigma-70 factor (ECF subfamily)